MRLVRPALIALALPLSAQSLVSVPSQRILAGFSALSTGGWADAFKEWEKYALPQETTDPGPRKQLEEWIPRTWSIGTCEQLQAASLTASWQRQWWLTSFDQGVVFFAFDFVHHKGEWRLFKIQVSRDPKALVPGLDLKVALQGK